MLNICEIVHGKGFTKKQTTNRNKQKGCVPMYTFENYINENKKEIIIDVLETKGNYDAWGLAIYGNEHLMVDYNIWIDNTTDETEISSAFYRLVLGEDGYLHHDDCSEWYSYMVDFTDEQWEEKLEEAAKRAFKELFDTKQTIKTIHGELMTDAQFDKYVMAECKRQWKENQDDMYGTWDEQSWNVQDKYFRQMYYDLLSE